jgi:RNA polymerase II transcription elongation factor
MAQFKESIPDLSKEYPLRLGKSITTPENKEISYCTMRYAFKPATVAECMPGCLLLEPNAKKVCAG